MHNGLKVAVKFNMSNLNIERHTQFQNSKIKIEIDKLRMDTICSAHNQKEVQ
jgi:hypothetical protein